MELGADLKKMKNNKSPGIDGLSSEFFKVFWGKLKHFTFMHFQRLSFDNEAECDNIFSEGAKR